MHACTLMLSMLITSTTTTTTINSNTELVVLRNTYRRRHTACSHSHHLHTWSIVSFDHDTIWPTSNPRTILHIHFSQRNQFIFYDRTCFQSLFMCVCVCVSSTQSTLLSTKQQHIFSTNLVFIFVCMDDDDNISPIMS